MSRSPLGIRHGAAPVLAIAIAVAVAVLSTVAALPAAAHSILVTTSPAPGARIEAVTQVRLDFAGDVAADGHRVSIRTADGGVAAASYERPQPSSVIARFDATIPDGAHEIVWEVVAADGDRERGRIPITVKAPTPPQAATSAPDAGKGGGAGGGSAPATGEDGDGGGFPAPVAVGIVVLAAAGVAAVLYHRHRHRHRSGSAAS